jgi:hypothetical protein
MCRTCTRYAQLAHTAVKTTVNCTHTHTHTLQHNHALKDVSHCVLLTIFGEEHLKYDAVKIDQQKEKGETTLLLHYDFLITLQSIHNF